MTDIFDKLPRKILEILYFNRNKLYVYKITRLGNISHAQTYKTIKMLKEKGLVETEVKGRRRYVELTEKGKKAVKLISKLKKMWEDA